MSTCVKIENLTLRYDNRKTDGINNLSFDVQKGKIQSLVGPSGSGKTTTLKCMANLISPQSGDIHFIEDCSMAYVDQYPNLDEKITVFENLENEIMTDIPDKEKRANQIRTTLAMLEITNEINSTVSNISGGQKQRVIIAMALVKNPTLLLLDEPFANLDKTLRAQLLEELFELFKEKEMTVVWVTHNTEEALSYSDNIALLNYGSLQQLGTPRELYYAPQNLFTAQFFSDVNLVPGKLINTSNNEVTVKIIDREYILKKPQNFQEQEHKDILVVIHPEHIIFDGDSKLTGKVIKSYFKGSRTIVEFSYQNLFLSAEISSNEELKDNKIHFSFATEYIYCLSEV